MIPSGDYPLEVKYTEKFGRIIRIKVEEEKVGKYTYGRIRLSKDYCGKEVAIFVSNNVLKEVKKKK